jgi:hypothetical protein
MSTIPNETVVSIGHNRLTVIANKIEAAHQRALRGGAEWVEGSIELAAAMVAGRDATPANITFSQWLKLNRLDFYSKNDRAALIAMGDHLDVMREVMTATTSRCYENIWRDNKKRFPVSPEHGTRKSRNSKPRTYNKGRKNLHRRMKLGDAMIDSLKGTTLDRSDELDELVILNRGAPEGEHTAIVKQLVADAVAGKDVSAIAMAASLGGACLRKNSKLVDAWRKRMLAAWQIASKKEQSDFVEYLINTMKPE